MIVSKFYLSEHWIPVVFSGLKNVETQPVRISWTRVTSWLRPAAPTTVRCPATPPLTTPCLWPTAACKYNALALIHPLKCFHQFVIRFKVKILTDERLSEAEKQSHLKWRWNSCTMIRERLARNWNWKDFRWICFCSLELLRFNRALCVGTGSRDVWSFELRISRSGGNAAANTEKKETHPTRPSFRYRWIWYKSYIVEQFGRLQVRLR